MNLVQSRTIDRVFSLSKEQWRVVSIIIVVSIVSIMPVGYHIIVLNVPEKIVQKAVINEMKRDFGVNLSGTSLNILWSFIVACQSIGALFGCLALMPFLNAFGVKNSLLMANSVLLMLGSICMFLSYYIQTTILLICGRILIGIYTGLSCGLLPIYIQELAPTIIKGALSCFIHIAVLIGATFAALFSLDTFFGTSAQWHILLSFPIFCVIFQMFYAKYLPNTPRYYLVRGKSLRAADSARYYYNLQCNEDSDAVKQYRKLVVKMPEQRSFWEAIKNRNARRGIGLGMLVSSSQILSGTMSVASFSSSMFSSISLMNKMVKLFPMLGAIFSILLSLPALKLVESSGRRPLLISTLIVCALSNYLLCVFSILAQYFDLKTGAFGLFTSSAVTLSFLLLGAAYNLGVGPVAYFVCAELVDVHFVSVAMACSIAINWITNLITTLIYYPINKAIGGYSYLIFAIPITICVMILHRHLPETKYNPKPENVEVKLSCNARYDDGVAAQPQRPYGTFNI